MSLFPQIGAHVSAAGDLSLAPQRSQEIGGECFQFFSRPPQGGPAKKISGALTAAFKNNLKKFGQSEAYIHAPYYINLASADNRIYYGSISIIRQELERASLLGVRYVMTHLGTAKDLGAKKGLAKVVAGLAKILDGYRGQAELLAEISAGSGETIGDSFEEIAKIIGAPSVKKYQIGVCFDTAHAFASGYDLRSEKTVKKTFADFARIVGLKKLKLIHANDSAAQFNSRHDRHEHIGRGKIGLAGFQAIAVFAKKNKINLILETPHDEWLKKDIKLLKKIRSGK